MSKIDKFEDLMCWQNARKLVNMVYHITCTGSISKDFNLKRRLRRAAISIMTNIAEDFARYHKKEFIRFLDISKNSAHELKSLLYIALDQSYLGIDRSSELIKLTDETIHLVLGLMRYLHKRAVQS